MKAAVSERWPRHGATYPLPVWLALAKQNSNPANCSPHNVLFCA